MKIHGRTLSFCLTFVALAVPAARAHAEDPPPVGTPPAGETAAHHGRVISGTGSGAGLGIGAASFISGLAGPQVVYDFGGFHLEGIFGLEHHTNNGPNPPSVTTFDLGFSGWYHLHAGDRSDFSVGGGLGFMVASPSQGNTATAVVLEPGIMARAFVTDNFAVNARVGLPIVFGDTVAAQGLGGLNPHWGLAGQITSLFGFTYYFR